ncbi:hypothetical protein FVE89_16280 [Methylobacterium sp. 2A]|jgi:hypothetical protein|uniref:plasmid mobilization protein n=1 Tax=Methylobacterium sp. 2A TaxID=2603816 RepID=UPI0013550193|nr:hypothetical protein [Methylobacterium sp. 2A]MWV23514.1 hypothetical protein [Methylobacterium sp. 2A]
MTGSRRSEKRRRTEQVQLRLYPDERLQYSAEAAMAGLTLAALARRRLAQQHVVARVDAELIRELRRLGGQLIQTKHKPHLAHEARRTLAEIGAAIAHLSGYAGPAR